MFLSTGRTSGWESVSAGVQQAGPSSSSQITSFRNLSKGQACATLQVDVVRVDQSAEGLERFADEEVGILAL